MLTSQQFIKILIISLVFTGTATLSSYHLQSGLGTGIMQSVSALMSLDQAPLWASMFISVFLACFFAMKLGTGNHAVEKVGG